jgi:hypothetical protein
MFQPATKFAILTSKATTTSFKFGLVTTKSAQITTNRKIVATTKKPTLTTKPGVTTARTTAKLINAFDQNNAMLEPTDEPYIQYKMSKLKYSSGTKRYFRQYGLFNCRYAFCDNLEVSYCIKQRLFYFVHSLRKRGNDRTEGHAMLNQCTCPLLTFSEAVDECIGLTLRKLLTCTVFSI